MKRLEPSTVTKPTQLSILHMWNSSKNEAKRNEKRAEQISPEENMPTKTDPSGRRRVASRAEKSVSQKALSDLRPLRNKAKGSAREKAVRGREVSQENTPPKLFPIFAKESALGISTVAPETSNNDVHPQKLATSKTKKTSSSQLIKRTASAPLKSSLELVADDVFSGPSSQSSQRTPQESHMSQVIEIADDEYRSARSAHETDGQSRHEPIVVESSPIGPPQPARKSATAGFFASRKLDLSNSPSKHSRNKLGGVTHVLWPDMGAQHVRGAQQAFSSAPLDFARRRPKSSLEDPVISLVHLKGSSRCCRSFHLPCAPRGVEPIGAQPNGHARREIILETSATCPAITRFLSADHDISGSSWNHRWRPRCAAEVLGNDTSAQYLRDWLLALEIKTDSHAGSALVIDFNVSPKDARITSNSNGKSSSGKRPNIIRAVDKPRKRRRVDSDEESLDDWIADDDEEEEEPVRMNAFMDEADDEWPYASASGSPWKPKLTRLSRKRPPDSSNSDISLDDKAHSSPVPVHDFSNRLTNSILLSGPAGSGKTAAIYACAEELGWEIFEVYPGIGRRNGASLLSLVGDVGKNHIVGRASCSMPNYLEKNGSMGNNTGQASADNRDPSDGKRRDRTSTPADCAESRYIGAHQSIILLEEVDILFGEDVNFWPTVVTLIKESRRPVIMTCNDPSLVPCSDLPLQTVLSFNPCPYDLARSYLRCLALTEGYAATNDHLKALYECNPPFDVLDASDDLVRSSARQLPPTSDLRRAINSLEFFCQGDPGLQEDASVATTNMELEHLTSLDGMQDDGIALHDFWDWDLPRNILSETRSTFGEQTDTRHKDASDIHRLWRYFDALSKIDSDLSRRPLAVLEMYASEGGSSSDEQLGYRHLIHESVTPHLQGGIVHYNYDEAIAVEAVLCARGTTGDARSSESEHIMCARTEGCRKPSAAELVRDQAKHFTRVSGILGRIVPAISTESVGTLVLDYEPWVRMIDRADAMLEAAASKEREARAAVRGGRTTRNSQRTRYEPYFNLDKEQRKELWESALRVDR